MNLNRLPLNTPQVRQLLLYCAPALLLAVILRVAMTVEMPYGYMQFDSVDFLVTPWALLARGGLKVHGKRTFLVPILYTLPFLLKLPVLLVIPLAQHLLGVATVAMVGALVRLWFGFWRWIIIPITVLTAANPVMIWFEQTLMSECVYLFCLVLLALAGTLFARRQSRSRLVWLFVAFFLTAGARPEGRLFLLFGFLLLLVSAWGQWKVLAQRAVLLLGLALVIMPISRTGQAGKLVYATLLPFGPEESRVDPQFGELMRPVRERVIAEKQDLNTELTSLEKEMTAISETYLEKRYGKNDPHSTPAAANSLCLKMAIEAAMNQPLVLPVLMARKFAYSNRRPASIGYDEPILHKKLAVGFTRKPWLNSLWGPLTGGKLTSPDQLDAFISAHYRPIGWYRWLDSAWQKITLRWHPAFSKHPASPAQPLSFFFILAFLGMVTACLASGPMRLLHFSWISTMLAIWGVVELTGVVNPRYRFAFEPFCVIYAFAVLGQLAQWATSLRKPAAAPAAEASSLLVSHE